MIASLEKLLNQNSFRNLISGADKGFFKTLLRISLRIVSIDYRIAVFLRNFGYNKGISSSRKAGVPVISIGNITTGGTGKTPLVIWLCKMLKDKSIPCAVLTRGYKAQDAEISDEPAILARACPDARIVVNPDRVAGAAKAVSEYGAKALVMDDGFQHRRLHRDLDIVAIDATCPFGFGHLLPAGLLREPKTAIKRAQAVVITHYNQSSAEKTDRLVAEIKRIAPDITIAKAVHKHTSAKIMKGRELSIEELKELDLYAFCGVGNPDAFLGNLESYGFNVKGSKVFNDHHDFTEEDMATIYDEAKKLDTNLILSTEKDWVKTALLVRDRFDIDFAFLTLELDFIKGADKIEALVDAAISS
ncbi:MAG: tetraacyldisaccharide 4'-kinase [Planctomycetes bacterium]|nr:tetraacyldisaccharide 4'-kinase [Planctomycetota bacterium]